ALPILLRFKDLAGNTVSYSLQPGNVSSLCGATGTASCDPRNLGMAPAIGQLWAMMPPGNDTAQGDGLNTIGFSGFAKFPLNTDLGVIRVDHTFNQIGRAHV